VSCWMRQWLPGRIFRVFCFNEALNCFKVKWCLFVCFEVWFLFLPVICNVLNSNFAINHTPIFHFCLTVLASSLAVTLAIHAGLALSILQSKHWLFLVFISAILKSCSYQLLSLLSSVTVSYLFFITANISLSCYLPLIL